MSKKSIKKNYVYNVIYQLLVIIIPVVVTPYIARVLNPEGVGAYSFAFSLITYFTIFAALGFGTYAQREIARSQDDIRRQSVIFWEILICRSIPVGLSLVTNLILTFCGVYGEYTTLMLLLSINIVAVFFDITFFFQGNEEFGKIVLINLVIKILGTAGIFIFVKQQSDVWIYALLNSLVLIISNLSIWCCLKKRLVKVKLSELKPMKHLKGALVLFMITLATSIYTILDRSFIGIITHSSAENGFYEQAEKIVRLSMTIVTCLSTIMTSRNSHEIEKGHINVVRENIYKTLHFLLLLGIPLTVGTILVVDNFVPWFLGTNYNQSVLLIKILAALILLGGINGAIGWQYLLPYKKDRQFTFAVTVGALVNLGLNIPLIYYWGALGAAIATVVAELVIALIMFLLVAKQISFVYFCKMAIKPLLASLVMVAAILPLSLAFTPSILHTFIMIGCGVLVYGVVILLLRDSLVINFLKGIKNKFQVKSQHEDHAANRGTTETSPRSNEQ